MRLSTLPGTRDITANATQSRINGYWDSRARDYHLAQRRSERVEADRTVWSAICAELLPTPQATILDVGTGSGFLAFVLAGLGHHVTGIDLSVKMLQVACERADSECTDIDNTPRFLHGDAINPAFPPGSFDAITSRYVLWTLQDPDFAARKWWELLRPGGRIAMVDAAWFPHGLDANPTEGFREHYSPEVRAHLPLAETKTVHSAASVLSGAGFVDITVTPLHSVHELDSRFGTVPGHEITLQYALTARKPQDSSGSSPDSASSASSSSSSPSSSPKMS